MLYWGRRFDQFAIPRRVLTGGVSSRRKSEGQFAISKAMDLLESNCFKEFT
jgi:hypothetical protein